MTLYRHLQQLLLEYRRWDQVVLMHPQVTWTQKCRYTLLLMLVVKMLFFLFLCWLYSSFPVKWEHVSHLFVVAALFQKSSVVLIAIVAKEEEHNLGYLFRWHCVTQYFLCSDDFQWVPVCHFLVKIFLSMKTCQFFYKPGQLQYG